VKRFLVALQFLTILPVRIPSEIAKEDFGRSLLYFPLVGMFIGLALSGTTFLSTFLPNPVVAVLIVILSIVLTGGIHLDGFADTCDGFYGHRSKEQILEIMRDSRVGVMGAAGVFCLLALKGTLIATIPHHVLWKLLIMMAVFARWSQVLVCCTSNYAREEGKARYFVEYAGKKELLLGGIFTVAVSLSLIKLKGPILLLVSLLPVLLFINYMKRRIGGVTGDTIGAASEIAELAVLFLGSIYLGA